MATLINNIATVVGALAREFTLQRTHLSNAFPQEPVVQEYMFGFLKSGLRQTKAAQFMLSWMDAWEKTNHLEAFINKMQNRMELEDIAFQQQRDRSSWLPRSYHHERHLEGMRNLQVELQRDQQHLFDAREPLIESILNYSDDYPGDLEDWLDRAKSIMRGSAGIHLWPADTHKVNDAIRILQEHNIEYEEEKGYGFDKNETAEEEEEVVDCKHEGVARDRMCDGKQDGILFRRIKKSCGVCARNHCFSSETLKSLPVHHGRRRDPFTNVPFSEAEDKEIDVLDRICANQK